jgi:hypothetical protein
MLHVNVILVDIPFRYDLRERPYVNEEIMKYNRTYINEPKGLKRYN